MTENYYETKINFAFLFIYNSLLLIEYNHHDSLRFQIQAIVLSHSRSHRNSHSSGMITLKNIITRNLFFKPVVLTGLILSSIRIQSNMSSSTIPTYVPGDSSIAYVTTPNDESARKIARELVSRKLCACVSCGWHFFPFILCFIFVIFIIYEGKHHTQHSVNLRMGRKDK